MPIFHGTTIGSGVAIVTPSDIGADNQVLTSKGDGSSVWGPGGGGGSSTFVGLTDTPADYAGAGGFLHRVNAGASAVEFVDGDTLYDAAGSAAAVLAALTSHEADAEAHGLIVTGGGTNYLADDGTYKAIPAGSYNEVYDSGLSASVGRRILDFRASGDASVEVTDVPGEDRTQITIDATAGSGGGGISKGATFVAGNLMYASSSAGDGTAETFAVTPGDITGHLAAVNNPHATTFQLLGDTPANFVGAGNFLTRVNAGATALEFVDGSTLYDAAGAAADVQTALDAHEADAEAHGLVTSGGGTQFLANNGNYTSVNAGIDLAAAFAWTGAHSWNQTITVAVATVGDNYPLISATRDATTIFEVTARDGATLRLGNTRYLDLTFDGIQNLRLGNVSGVPMIDTGDNQRLIVRSRLDGTVTDAQCVAIFNDVQPDTTSPVLQLGYGGATAPTNVSHEFYADGRTVATSFNGVALTSGGGGTNYLADDGTYKAVAGGTTTFVGLTDTPANYSGAGGFLCRVNAGASAVEFVDGSTLYDAAGAAAAVQTALDAHEADLANPHAVTAAQAGADPAGSAATVQGNLDTHTGTSAIHFADAAADGNAYARQDNAWQQSIRSDNTVNDVISLTQTAYDAIGTKDPKTLYVIVG